MLTTLLAAVIVLGPVIVFHEFGHFIVAKLAGIYVKTFSVGFGPKLLRKRFGETEYALSALPLGGYVRMAGEADTVAPVDTAADTAAPAAVSGIGEAGQEAQPVKKGEAVLYPTDGVSDADIPPHRYLRNKPIATRLAVVTAGPFANLILAIIVLTAAFHHEGMPVLATTALDSTGPDSTAARLGLHSGDEIRSIAGKTVTNTLEVIQALESQTEAPFPIVVQKGERDTTLVVPGVRREHGEVVFPRFNFRPDTRIGTVKMDGPAARAGLQAGDRIVSVDGKPVQYYDEFAALVRPAIGKPLEIVWERDGKLMSATVTPESGDAPDPEHPNKSIKVGRVQIEMYRLVVPIGWGQASRQSVTSCWFLIRATAEALGELVRGKGSRDAIGGPIRIAQEAGSELRWGISRLFMFMGFFSVNLFLLNMLPVPVLDGGHVLFLVIEAVRGQALSVRVQELALKFGVSALIALMAWVVVMDLWRVISR